MVTMAFVEARWPIPDGERQVRLPMPLAMADRDLLGERRNQAAFAGDVQSMRAVAANAIFVTNRRAAMTGLGFARVYGAQHLRAGERTTSQMLAHNDASPAQLESVGRAAMLTGMPSLRDLMVQHHFPVTRHTQAEQTAAAAFLDRAAADIVGEVRQADARPDDIEVSEITGAVKADVRNKILRDRLARFVRRARAAGIPTEVLHREALLRVIEADAADALAIRHAIEQHLTPLERRLFDIVMVGEPRGQDNRVILPPLATSVWFRAALELGGGFREGAPPELQVIPDLIDVLAGANPRLPEYASSVRKAIGFVRMSGTWLEADRATARETKERIRGADGKRRYEAEQLAEGNDNLPARPARPIPHDD